MSDKVRGAIDARGGAPPCPECGAEVRPGDPRCWLCDADLRGAARPSSPAPSPDEMEPQEDLAPTAPGGRPRVRIATLMVVVGVVAVFLAVAREEAGVAAGLLLILGPPALYLVARARRIGAGAEEPSPAERSLAYVTMTVMWVILASGLLAAAVILAVVVVGGMVSAVS